MTPAENKEVVRRYLEEGLGTSNMDLVCELLAPGCVSDSPMPASEWPDGEVATRLAEALFAAFPDLRITVEDMVAEGDVVFARYGCRGTHHGDLGVMRASGRSARFVGIGMYRLSEGRIGRVWPGMDWLALIRPPGVQTAVLKPFAAGFDRESCPLARLERGMSSTNRSWQPSPGQTCFPCLPRGNGLSMASRCPTS